MDSETPAGFEPASYASCFHRDGYFVQERAFPEHDVACLRDAIESIPDGQHVRRKRGVYGIRNLLEICPAVRSFAAMPAIRRFVAPVLGEEAFAVRGILFDKVPGANWSLFWHQDNVVSVRRHLDAPDFVGWSQKAGVWQVQPPAEVLANMIAVRVHLDDCGEDSGPLRVIPGSHRHGWLDDRIDDWKSRMPEAICTVACGGIVAMCPLVLHASAAADSVGHRRVIHLEFAAADLPGGLEWNNRVGPAFDQG